jgi:hypothetical protein
MMFTVSSGLQVTLRLCEGLVFETLLPGGNGEKECDDEIIEMFFRTSQAPNRS